MSIKNEGAEGEKHVKGRLSQRTQLIGWRRFVRGISIRRIFSSKIFARRISEHGLFMYRTFRRKEFSPQFEKDI